MGYGFFTAMTILSYVWTIFGVEKISPNFRKKFMLIKDKIKMIRENNIFYICAILTFAIPIVFVIEHYRITKFAYCFIIGVFLAFKDIIFDEL